MNPLEKRRSRAPSRPRCVQSSLNIRTAAYRLVPMGEEKKRKNPAAVALGRRGGKQTAQNLTPEQRSGMARKAVQARWAKAKAQKGA